MSNPQRPSVTRFLYVFWFGILFMIGLGIYCDVTNTSTGGRLYGRYGGSAYTQYGGNGVFLMVAVLLLGALFIKIIGYLKK